MTFIESYNPCIAGQLSWVSTQYKISGDIVMMDGNRMLTSYVDGVRKTANPVSTGFCRYDIKHDVPRIITVEYGGSGRIIYVYLYSDSETLDHIYSIDRFYTTSGGYYYSGSADTCLTPGPSLVYCINTGSSFHQSILTLNGNTGDFVALANLLFVGNRVVSYRAIGNITLPRSDDNLRVYASLTSSAYYC